MENKLKNTILVTGSNGFLGHFLREKITERWMDDCCFFLDVEGEFNKRGDVKVDLRDYNKLAEVINRVQPSIVFHLAGSFNQNDLNELYGVNVNGTVNLLEAVKNCVHREKTRIILTSSASVYDGNIADRKDALTEDAVISPLSHYGASKAAAEMVSRIYSDKHDMDIITVRLFNLIGPGLSPAFLPGRLAREIAKIRKGVMEPVVSVGNMSPVRDYLDVKDAAKAYVKLALADSPKSIYNLASGSGISVCDLIQLFVKMAGNEVEIIQDKKYYKEHDVKYSVADISRISTDIGWRPEVPIEKSVTDMIEAYM